MAESVAVKSAMSIRSERLRNRFLNAWHARRAGLTAPATAFVSQPEPRTIGSYAKGRQLMAGNFLFAGHLIEAPDTVIWDIRVPDAAFENTLHGFSWLDDLAAVADGPARKLAQTWMTEWIRRHGGGRGPGWTPELTGRRLIRWINHAVFLLGGLPKAESDAYFRSLARMARFLERRWSAAKPGLPSFEALTGMIYAGLALEGMGGLTEPATVELASECMRRVDPDGGIPSRNPEELMEVFTLLTWAAAALSEGGKVPRREHILAVERIAPTLRALRHSDGGLARFHGGGRGLEGRLDQALVTSGVRATAVTGLAMGYARLSGGRTSIIVDAAPPPAMEHSANAHASTLAFELTSGRRPLIVNCGPGAQFGINWHRAGRATPSHSTLCLDGFSSSRFAPRGFLGDSFNELLVDAPEDVRAQQSSGLDGQSLLATHDGYSQSHGLLHVRRLDLSTDGRVLRGEDTLGALSEGDRMRFEAMMDRTKSKGVQYSVRFHLHPDVFGEIDMGDTAVSLSLKSGEIWVFRHDGSAELTIEPSVYLEHGRLKPRATKQIVLSLQLVDYASQISWSLERAQDGTSHVRDLAREDVLAQD